MATPEATSPVCVARDAAASPSTPVRKAEESLEACLSAERKKRRKTGALPSIPAISLAPFREGTAEGKQSVAKQWDEACREVGFIKIVDHGVPKEVIERCWKATEDFFDRPAEEKLKVPMTDDYPYGYNAIGGENLLASLDKGVKNPGDLKEMFNVCIGSAAPAPDHPPPRWPDNSLEQQEAYVAYYRALESLAATLYHVCALALGLPEDWFDDKLDQHRDVIRAIHYPRQQPPTVPQPGQVRASMHTDYGSLTILRLGGEFPGGLQVMGANGSWVDVTSSDQENAFVINLGDLMARWTNDRWLSTPHQVVNPPQELAARSRRQSIAYFCNINMDAQVQCIATCRGDTGPKYDPITAGEWLMRKHLQTVAGKRCYEKA